MKLTTTLLCLASFGAALAAKPEPTKKPCRTYKIIPAHFIAKGGPVDRFQLAGPKLAGGPATLEAAGFRGPWKYENGGVGVWDGCDDDIWLTIERTDKHYKALTWEATQKQPQTFTVKEGKKLVANAARAHPKSDTFWACQNQRPYKGLDAGHWVLFLLAGEGQTPVSSLAQQIKWSSCVKTNLVLISAMA